jgi:hypothetical protein
LALAKKPFFPSGVITIAGGWLPRIGCIATVAHALVAPPVAARTPVKAAVAASATARLCQQVRSPPAPRVQSL